MPQMINIPRLATGGAMNIHIEFLSLEQRLHFVSGQMFRLHVGLIERMDFHETEFRQPGRNIFASDLSRLIFVEHDDDVTVPVGVFPNQLLLRGRHRAAQEGNHFAPAELMESHAIEEAFDDDPWFVRRFFDGAIQIEQLQRFFETLREFVFRCVRRGIARPTTAVGNHVAGRIMNRYGDAFGHHAFGAIADAEINDGFERQTARDQIRMLTIEFVQPEF